MEFTSRSSSEKYTFRPNALQTVVVNGGSWSQWQTSYSTSQNGPNYNYDLHWYMGGNTIISGPLTLGTNSSYESNTSIINQNIELTITGGQVSRVDGASFGINSTSFGNRIIKIIGDGGSSITTNPKITNIYGGAYEGTLTGNIYLTIKGATNITNVYGGGYAFTATTYGDVNVTIENSIISGDIYGGGYNGNVAVDDSGNGGNVLLNITGSKVNGNIYGSGQGGTQTLSTLVSIVKTQASTNWQNEVIMPTDSDWQNVKDTLNGDYDTNWDWESPASGFPFMQEETEYICTAIYKATTWTNLSADNLTFQRYYLYSYLSAAIVEKDVDITIDSSTIGTRRRYK